MLDALLTAARRVVELFQGYEPHAEAKAALATLQASVAQSAALEQAEAICANLGCSYTYDADKGEVTLIRDGAKQPIKVGSPFWALLVERLLS